MTQIEFVTELEQALRGNVEERIIQENVRYYNDYISEQRAAGKSEEEIFASLGSPRLIAKTIIDTSGEASTQGNSRAGSYNYSTGSDDSSTGGDERDCIPKLGDKNHCDFSNCSSCFSCIKHYL